MVFRALGDGARRAMLEILSRGETALSGLAGPLEISLPAAHQHVAVLEKAGLVACEKRGRKRICRLDPCGFTRAEAWLAAKRKLWETRLDALAAHLERDRGGHA